MFNLFNRIASLVRYLGASAQVRWTIKNHMVQFNLSLDEAVRYHEDVGFGRTCSCVYVDQDGPYGSSVVPHMTTWEYGDVCQSCNTEFWKYEMFA